MATNAPVPPHGDDDRDFFKVKRIDFLGAKRAILGPVAPGGHALWSAYFLRWWLVERLLGPARMILEYLSGSPLAPAVWRLFGARVGAGTLIDRSRQHWGQPR